MVSTLGIGMTWGVILLTHAHTFNHTTPPPAQYKLTADHFELSLAPTELDALKATGSFRVYRPQFVYLPVPLRDASNRIVNIIEKNNLICTSTTEQSPFDSCDASTLQHADYPLHTPACTPEKKPVPIELLPSLDSVLELSNGVYATKTIAKKPLLHAQNPDTTDPAIVIKGSRESPANADPKQHGSYGARAMYYDPSTPLDMAWEATLPTRVLGGPTQLRSPETYRYPYDTFARLPLATPDNILAGSMMQEITSLFDAFNATHTDKPGYMTALVYEPHISSSHLPYEGVLGEVITKNYYGSPDVLSVSWIPKSGHGKPQASIMIALGDANGVFRKPATDTRFDERATPCANLFGTRCCEQLGQWTGRAFVIPQGIPARASAHTTTQNLRLVERFAIPISLATKDPPIFALVKLDSWSPWGEDVELVHAPEPGKLHGLRRVLIFDNASDAQIEKALRSLTSNSTVK